MGTNKIAKSIKEECADDRDMREFLMELLEFTMSGSKWYKDEYNKLIEKYTDWEEQDEN